MKPYRYLKGTLLVGLICCAGSLLNCSSSEAPVPPDRIVIVSGDNQYSKYGMELMDPLVVKVTNEDGTEATNVPVVFKVVTGGGSVSKTQVNTNNSGNASSKLILGPSAGMNSVVAHIEENKNKFVVFNATASYTYCEEAETTLAVSYAPNPDGYLFLATPKSSLYPNHAAIARIYAFSGGEVTQFVGFPPGGTFTTQIWDIAFSPHGDLFISMDEISEQILKITPNGSYSEFAPIDDFFGYFVAAEITGYPDGLLAGCNNKGPFIVTCGDSIMRFSGATYSGEINNDAVAADPVTDDIYFIHQTQETLLRLPLDTLVATGPVEIVADLTSDEATGARGMLCDADRMIYILIDTENTKKILKVSAIDGTKTDLYDFFSRGTGTPEEAGMQRDLALDPNHNFLYTLDTLNNELLVYTLPGGPLQVAIQDSTLSTTSMGGERVGIAVLK